VQAAVAPLVALFFAADLARHLAWLAALLALGSVGFAAAGTVFSAALLRAKSRDVLLSALLFPVLIPLLLAGAKATSHLLDPNVPDMEGAVLWTRFLAVVDVLYVVLGLWAFEPIVTGD
jgi:heme exporter protein B